MFLLKWHTQAKAFITGRYLVILFLFIHSETETPLAVETNSMSKLFWMFLADESNSSGSAEYQTKINVNDILPKK